MIAVASDEQDMLARARQLRGPWWWRLRCWAADRLLAAGSRVDPDDRTCMHWYSDDRSSMYFAQIRRPR